MIFPLKNVANSNDYKEFEKLPPRSIYEFQHGTLLFTTTPKKLTSDFLSLFYRTVDEKCAIKINKKQTLHRMYLIFTTLVIFSLVYTYSRSSS